MSDPGHTTPAARLGWYLNRLRCMTPAEIPHRLLRAVSARAEARGLRPRKVPQPRMNDRGVMFMSPRIDVDVATYTTAADRILAGRLDVFSLDAAELGQPPRWNRDPRTGTEAPLTFGKTLNYRDPAVVGDIKYLWEPNRHLQLVTLAQAYALSGEQRYAAGFRQQLDDWIVQCPAGMGANWASALEPAMRLINWSLAWQLLGGLDSALFADREGRAFRDRWLRSVYEHARFIRGFYSRHSSANNHLIGEAVGVFVASTTWPYWPQLARWGRGARQILEHEVPLQNGADGVNHEQAFAYQQFELDLLLIAVLSANAGGEPFSDAFMKRMESMVSFLATVMDAGGNVPMVGDSDDGYVVRLSQQDDFCPYRSLFASAALLFGRADLMHKAQELDDKTRWLFRGSKQRAPEAIAKPWSRPRQAFAEGGYYLLGCDFDTSHEIRLLADAGPLGYREIAAHGHADALSFVLSIGGLPFLIDPGTYAYHADDAWREYFRGTSAHNTLTVDGRNQSESGGNFMWLWKARAGCEEFSVSDDRQVLDAWQDGYLRLDDPVAHRRRIEFDRHARRFHIDDILSMQGSHAISLYFHCHEDCDVSPDGDGLLLSRGERAVRLSLPDAIGADTRIVRGSEDPPLGWVSRRFDCKQATATIVWTAELSQGCRLRTTLQC
jgi:Heparinase II/III-like protein/Heparinase II/III N-terminus